jgi:hypothetical protein
LSCTVERRIQATEATVLKETKVSEEEFEMK